ncbi:MAG: hypothetical protein L3J02_01910 [Henriciella sp.]|nr:hypothetical protein [Henriciella sp.]
MDQDLQAILSQVEKLGEMSEIEAKRIVDDVYRDGIVSRAEAEALFLMNDNLVKADARWNDRFIEAVKDFLITREAPEGWVTSEECDWLLVQINKSGSTPGLLEIDLVLSLLRYAEGAPVELSRFGLNAISGQIVAAGKASAEMVERMRKALYASSGETGIWVSRYEATVLFKTNDAIGFAKNHASWNDLFARAIGNHLLASAHPDPQSEDEALARAAWLEDTSSNIGGFISKMAGSFAQDNWFNKITFDPQKAARAREVANAIALREAEKVTKDENAWFMKRLGWDQKISPAERALIGFLKAEAPGFTHGLAIAA